MSKPKIDVMRIVARTIGSHLGEKMFITMGLAEHTEEEILRMVCREMSYFMAFCKLEICSARYGRAHALQVAIESGESIARPC